MSDLHYIDLRALTRDEGCATTEGSVSVLLGSEEIAAFPVPPRGESIGLSQSVSLEVAEGQALPVSLRVNGTDPWGPREVIVSAQYSEQGGQRRTCAVAVARPSFEDPSGTGILVAEDSAEAVSQLTLARFRQAMDTDFLDQFLLVTATDRSYARTSGRLELTVRASLGGVPAVVFQTDLPKVGRQEPGQQGGYLYRFQVPKPGIPSALLHSVSISNRSDDAWGLAGAELYGWGVNELGQPVGGLLSDSPSQRVISQDCSDCFPDPAPDLHLETGWQKGGTSDTFTFRLFESPVALP